MSLPLADRLLVDLATPDRRAAAEHCARLVSTGLSLDELVDDGLAPAMAQVGSFCESGVYTVVDEHTATAAAEAGLSAAAAECPARRDRGEIVVACVAGDWHSLPARMVAEVLVAHGWAVRFLGAAQPIDQLVDHLGRHRPQAVLLSCAIPTALPTVTAAVQAVHDLSLPVFVGGHAFGADARRALVIGADGWSATAAGAAELLERRPEPVATARNDDMLATYRLRHLLLPDWVAEAMPELTQLIPAVRTFSPEVRNQTIADLLHLLDTACIALMLRDPKLLSEHCSWLSRVMTANTVPSEALDRALTALCIARPVDAFASAVEAALRRAQRELVSTTSVAAGM